MDVSSASTAADARREREVEYGQYVAAEEIRLDGALAFNVGDPVPVGHVKKYHLAPAVTKVEGPKAEK